MVNLRERRRRVNLDSLSEEDFNRIMDQLGEKFKKICDSATEQANRIAKPYGFTVKLQFMAEPVSKQE